MRDRRFRWTRRDVASIYTSPLRIALQDRDIENNTRAFARRETELRYGSDFRGCDSVT